MCVRLGEATLGGQGRSLGKDDTKTICPLCSGGRALLQLKHEMQQSGRCLARELRLSSSSGRSTWHHASLLSFSPPGQCASKFSRLSLQTKFRIKTLFLPLEPPPSPSHHLSLGCLWSPPTGLLRSLTSQPPTDSFSIFSHHQPE